MHTHTRTQNEKESGRERKEREERNNIKFVREDFSKIKHLKWQIARILLKRSKEERRWNLNGTNWKHFLTRVKTVILKNGTSPPGLTWLHHWSQVFRMTATPQQLESQHSQGYL